MDWTHILSSLIETGGLVAVLTFFLTSTEKKANAQLSNMQRMYENLQSLYDKLQARYDIETDKVGKLYDQIGQKNELIDSLNTKVAIGELKRCDCINCTKRQPPIGDKWRIDHDNEGKEEAA